MILDISGLPDALVSVYEQVVEGADSMILVVYLTPSCLCTSRSWKGQTV